MAVVERIRVRAESHQYPRGLEPVVGCGKQQRGSVPGIDGLDVSARAQSQRDSVSIALLCGRKQLRVGVPAQPIRADQQFPVKEEGPSHASSV